MHMQTFTAPVRTERSILEDEERQLRLSRRRVRVVTETDEERDERLSRWRAALRE